MWMNDAPHLLKRLRFKLSVQKQVLHFGLLRQVLSSAKGFFRLLIIVVRVMELKQARRWPRMSVAEIEKDDWLPIGMRECCVNDCIVEFTLRHQHGQGRTGQVFFTVGERYG